MKNAMMLGMFLLAAACAGLGARPQGDSMSSGRWQGFLLRDGLRAPVEIQLSDAGSEWTGRFSAGDNSVALERVRVKGNDVHFELAGTGVFDGSVGGDSMAGLVSGPVGGSFFLHRQDAPPWNIEFMMGP
jgi:hypothetical protein